MNNINIAPPVKPETQSARLQLNLTPSLKARVVEASRRYDVSANSLICQLIDGGLLVLAEKEAGE